MSSKVQQFRDFMTLSDIKLEERETEEATYFSLKSSPQGFGSFIVVAFFPRNEEIVSLFSLDYLSVARKRKDILEKLNVLNYKYTYCKFTLNEDLTIQVSVFLETKKTFCPETILEMMVSVCKVLEDEYEGLRAIL